MATANGTSPAQLKQTLGETIDSQFDAITGIADRILRHPETGYKEFETAGVVDEWLTQLDYSPPYGYRRHGCEGRARYRTAWAKCSDYGRVGRAAGTGSSVCAS